MADCLQVTILGTDLAVVTELEAYFIYLIPGLTSEISRFISELKEVRLESSIKFPDEFDGVVNGSLKNGT